MSDDKNLLITKIKLIALMAVFGVPLVVALIFARLSDDGLPDFVGTSNNGDFMVPVVPLTEWDLRTPEGQSLDEGVLQDDTEEWTLVYLSINGCAPVCQRQIYSMRQLRLMQGRNALRLDRLFIYGGLLEKEVASVAQSFPEMKMATGSEAELQRIQQQFQQPGHNSSDRIYLVDPVGQAMMSYPADIKPRLIYKDLKKLLKVTSTE
ncbi:conserved hypothetical protein [gamma proteobacterium HTCC5015]|nr:conserved hypothetical protein [gamma proteobacterium HTCC5015]